VRLRRVSPAYLSMPIAFRLCHFHCITIGAASDDASDQPACLLVLCTPSCGLDQMFAELDATGAGGMPNFDTLAAIAAKFGVTIEPPAA
jgi:hypothetical protein